MSLIAGIRWRGYTVNLSYCAIMIRRDCMIYSQELYDEYADLCFHGYHYKVKSLLDDYVLAALAKLCEGHYEVEYESIFRYFVEILIKKHNRFEHIITEMTFDGVLNKVKSMESDTDVLMFADMKRELMTINVHNDEFNDYEDTVRIPITRLGYCDVLVYAATMELIRDEINNF